MFLFAFTEVANNRLEVTYRLVVALCEQCCSGLEAVPGCWLLCSLLGCQGLF